MSIIIYEHYLIILSYNSKYTVSRKKVNPCIHCHNWQTMPDFNRILEQQCNV